MLQWNRLRNASYIVTVQYIPDDVDAQAEEVVRDRTNETIYTITGVVLKIAF